MDDLEMVRFCEGGHHLTEHVHDARIREEPVLVGHAGEVTPAEELHHEVELAPVATEVDDADWTLEQAQQVMAREQRLLAIVKSIWRLDNQKVEMLPPPLPPKRRVAARALRFLVGSS